MSTIQDKIEESSIKLRRRLFDFQIKLQGLEVIAPILKIIENKYGDAQQTLISKDTIECVIEYPSDMPIIRTRNNEGALSLSVESNTSNVHLFDILPITVLTKWESNIEKGDLIIHKYKDEHNIYSLIILQITETLGAFRNNLLWKRNNAALYNEPLSEELQTVIDFYKDSI